MIKIKNIMITFLLVACFIPIEVLAKGEIKLSPSTITLTKGEEKEFTITADNAAGRVDITSNNTSVATVSESSIFLDMDTQTIKVKALSVGNSKIEVYTTDVTTYDDEDISGKTYTIDIEVIDDEKKDNKNLSTNNNLKDITVENYKLEKKDNNNYKLIVNNDIPNIFIKAETEDSKAKISGVGKQNLDVGTNNIEIIVTSESGLQNKINLEVIRKEGNKIEKLDELLKSSSNEEINIVIDYDTVLSTNDLTKIKNNDKLVKFNYFDDNNKLIYSWQVDGAKIEDTNNFLTSVSYLSDYVDNISKLTDNKEGLYISLKNDKTNLEGYSLKIYVGDKFKDEETLKIESYDQSNNKLNLNNKNVTVKGGYITFAPKNKELFLTNQQDNENNVIKLLPIIGIAILVAVSAVIAFVFVKRNKNK